MDCAVFLFTFQSKAYKMLTFAYDADVNMYISKAVMKTTISHLCMTTLKRLIIVIKYRLYIQ